ncbi:MAG TPA: hypothetical protein VEK07_12050 [Polyangiaceae bacterium]|nr:hypothetical protein [Polyangiaceae bacterium]
MRLRRFSVLAGILALAGILVLAACHGSAQGDCSNGTCGCPGGTTCDFTCDSPPCSIDCLSGSTCSAPCADGTCTCEEGAACDFACESGPCQVSCVGSNPSCAGQCWDGECTCGSGSACAFQCASPPCHATCAPDSSCVVTCPTGTAGASNCDLSCGGVTATVCSDGVTLTCNASCP